MGAGGISFPASICWPYLLPTLGNAEGVAQLGGMGPVIEFVSRAR